MQISACGSNFAVDAGPSAGGFISTIVLMAMLPVVALAQEAAPSEYQVKARLLLVFLDFVEWPADAFSSDDAPVIIGVLGEDPFGKDLDQVLRNQQVRGRPIAVRRARQAEDLLSAHLVFVSQSERNQLAEVLAILDRGPAVTLSEVNGFCRRGGILNFSIEDRKISFEANPSAARQKGIRLGAQLLKRATIIGPQP